MEYRVGDVTVIDGDSTSYPAELYGKRERIISDIKENGYKNVIEEFAYTWFNRLVALRFMEVHGFVSHGFRVLSNPAGGIEPEILKNLGFVKSELKLDMTLCEEFKQQGKIEELFRYVLTKQCNALSDQLPMLFSSDMGYLDLLLPQSLLKGDTVITKMWEIPEESFLEDVEIIGWLYQFYVADNRKQYRELKIITKDKIPTLTQIFTTDWIVRYMAQNSLGRIWLESYPSSSLRSKLPYYVENAEQTNEIQQSIENIRYQAIKPEEISIIEPCCGSGHILVYMFDLLFEMYEERGYQRRDIPGLILRNNLIGLDIDRRAAQLASFSLVMKARSINSRFFEQEYYTMPQIYEIKDSKLLIEQSYLNTINDLNLLTDSEIQQISRLVETFKNAKIIGSLLRPIDINFDFIESSVLKIEEKAVPNLFNSEFLNKGIIRLKELVTLARLLTKKYDLLITNPPYLGISSLEVEAKEWLSENYTDSKSDMSAMFMEVPLVKANGFRAIVNPDSWMFLVSYEKMRRKIIDNATIINLIHLGLGVFDSTVQTTAFVMRESNINMMGKYYRLVNSKEKENDFLNHKYEYLFSMIRFKDIPADEFVYWLPDKIVDSFSENTIGKYAISDGQTKTGNNDKYLRLLWEVDKTKTGRGKKWVPHAKGGVFRKWYGNIDTFIDWSEEARTHYRKDKVARISPEYIWFREGICWNLITSSPKFAARILTDDSTFNLAAPSVFFETHEQTFWVLGLLNTIVAETIIRALNPTLNTNIGDIMNQPLFDVDKSIKNEVLNKVADCLNLSKMDWNSFETSWNFEKHPFMEWTSYTEEEFAWASQQVEDPIKSPIDYAFVRWMLECDERFNHLKANEEKLNQIFIDIYGLQEELPYEVDDADVTVRLADYQRDFKSFISYLVGVVMGRYSLDTPGLVYAGGEWSPSMFKSYQPDDDGIVPIYTGVGMEDGLTARVAELVKIIFGEESFRENMDTIADALGKASNESSLETLNRYLNDGFYP